MPDIPLDALHHWDVLVVDDDEDSLYIVQYVLNLYGARAHTTTDGIEALKIARYLRPRLIISDLSMPQFDGWLLAKKLKEDPMTAHIPIIALTAFARIYDRERLFQVGFHNYLNKPLIIGTFMQDLLSLLVNAPGIGEEIAPYFSRQ